MTTQQLASYLRISTNHVYYYLKREKIPSILVRKDGIGRATRERFIHPLDVVHHLAKLNPGQVIDISEKYL